MLHEILMTQMLVHILTLMAFATHVVGGCCVHHRHAGEECDHVSSCAHHQVHLHQGGHGSCADAAIDVTQNSSSDESAPGHPCEEGNCLYDVAKSVHTAVSIDLLLTDVLQLRNATCCGVSGWRLDPRDVVENAFETAASRCALLQSWQV